MRASRTTLALLVLMLPAVAGGCGPRQVEVRTAPSSRAESAVQVTNNLATAVNVYVSTGGSNMFLRQVPARSTLTLQVSGIAAGTTVTLRASAIDGSRAYERRDVVLGGTIPWTVP
jgi:hypothetical protein